MTEGNVSDEDIGFKNCYDGYDDVHVYRHEPFNVHSVLTRP